MAIRSPWYPLLSLVVLTSLVLPAVAAPKLGGGGGGGGAGRQAGGAAGSGVYASTATAYGRAAKAGGATKPNITGRKAYPAYPVAGVNVTLPDPNEVGPQRRQTQQQRQTAAYGMQSSLMQQKGIMQEKRQGKLSTMNAYHGISGATTNSSAGPGLTVGEGAGAGRFRRLKQQQ